MIAAFFLTSAMTVDNDLTVGKPAPEIETIQGINVVNDANSKGKTKVVSFWTPKQPASRITNKEMSLKYGSENPNVEFISICSDTDSDLMKEVVKIDGLKAEKIYSHADLNPRVFKDYGVEERPATFIINADGKISEIL